MANPAYDLALIYAQQKLEKHLQETTGQDMYSRTEAQTMLTNFNQAYSFFTSSFGGKTIPN